MSAKNSILRTTVQLMTVIVCATLAIFLVTQVPHFGTDKESGTRSSLASLTPMPDALLADARDIQLPELSFVDGGHDFILPQPEGVANIQPVVATVIEDTTLIEGATKDLAGTVADIEPAAGVAEEADPFGLETAPAPHPGFVD